MINLILYYFSGFSDEIIKNFLRKSKSRDCSNIAGRDCSNISQNTNEPVNEPNTFCTNYNPNTNEPVGQQSEAEAPRIDKETPTEPIHDTSPEEDGDKSPRRQFTEQFSPHEDNIHEDKSPEPYNELLVGKILDVVSHSAQHSELLCLYK